MNREPQMSRGTLQVTISGGESWHRLLDAVKRLSDSFANLGRRLGLPDLNTDPHTDRNRRCKQRELRDHVMRVCAGNRRRQMRSRGLS